MTTRTSKARQQQARLTGLFHSQCRGRRDGHQSANACAGTLVNHLVAGPTGDQHKASSKRHRIAGQAADQLVQRVVAADILA